MLAAHSGKRTCISLVYVCLSVCLSVPSFSSNVNAVLNGARIFEMTEKGSASTTQLAYGTNHSEQSQLLWFNQTVKGVHVALTEMN